MMSNELDILVVGFHQERMSPEIRKAFRHWQVYSVAAPGSVYGRRWRRAYFTDAAASHPNGERVISFLRSQGEVRNFDTFAPEFDVQSFEDSQLLRDLRRSRHPAV